MEPEWESKFPYGRKLRRRANFYAQRSPNPWQTACRLAVEGEVLLGYILEMEFGLALAGGCWENIVCKQRLTWDQPNIFRGDLDTGERTFGNDYYQNMMLWSLAAVSGPCAPGGLVERVIKAGKQP